MKKHLICVLSLALLSTLFGAKAIDDTKIGLRNTSLLDENLSLPEIKWDAEFAGSSKLIERSFENAPPLISHSLEDLVPITTDNNSCLTCHMPEVAKDVGATAVPKSHLTDMFSGKDLAGALSQERFNCTQCHVEQADAKPLVKNTFKSEFRYKDGKSKSNLIDILNQGVE